MTIAQALAKAAQTLGLAGVPDAVRESSTLLQFATGRDRTFMIAHPEYRLAPAELSVFEDALGRRAAREPLSYITGRKEFYGLEFSVTPAVLIPRPETEMLVERAIQTLQGLPAPEFAEIGIGSGCIAISILVNIPQAKAIGADISADAIAVAAANARTHLVAERLELLGSDIFENFGERQFDMIVSNPPYVPAAEIARLQPEVGRFEPRGALTDEADGLSIIRRIIRESPRALKKNGSLLLEFGMGQDREIAASA